MLDHPVITVMVRRTKPSGTYRAQVTTIEGKLSNTELQEAHSPQEFDDLLGLWHEMADEMGALLIIHLYLT